MKLIDIHRRKTSQCIHHNTDITVDDLTQMLRTLLFFKPQRINANERNTLIHDKHNHAMSVHYKTIMMRRLPFTKRASSYTRPPFPQISLININKHRQSPPFHHTTASVFNLIRQPPLL